MVRSVLIIDFVLLSIPSHLAPLVFHWLLRPRLCVFHPTHQVASFSSRQQEEQETNTATEVQLTRPFSTLFKHRARSAGLQSGRQSNASGLQLIQSVSLSRYYQCERFCLGDILEKVCDMMNVQGNLQENNGHFLQVCVCCILRFSF